MTTPPEPSRAEAVERVRRALLETFDSYHSNIQEQSSLVEALVVAVEDEERRRCLGIARRGASAAGSADARQAVEAVVRAMEQK